MDFQAPPDGSEYAMAESFIQTAIAAVEGSIILHCNSTGLRVYTMLNVRPLQRELYRVQFPYRLSPLQRRKVKEYMRRRMERIHRMLQAEATLIRQALCTGPEAVQRTMLQRLDRFLREATAMEALAKLNPSGRD